MLGLVDHILELYIFLLRSSVSPKLTTWKQSTDILRPYIIFLAAESHWVTDNQAGLHGHI